MKIEGQNKKAIILISCTLVFAFLILFFFERYQVKREDEYEYVENVKGVEENIPLKLYTIGEKPIDFDLVLAEANKILKEKIEVELSVEFISKKDAEMGYGIIFAGGADFDLIAVDEYNYNLFGSISAYMNLTEDMIKKCSPQLVEVDLDEIRINKIAYMIPSGAHLENSIAILVRGDLAKKYGIKKLNTISSLEYFLGLIKNNEENIIPFDVGMNGIEILQFLTAQPNQISIYDSNLIGIQKIGDKEKVLWLPDTMYFDTYLKRIKTWSDFGYIPSNASNKKKVLTESFLEGKTAIAIGTIFDMENLRREVQLFHPDFEPVIVSLGNQKYTNYYSPIQNGIAIRNGSKNAAKSLMLIEQLRINKDLFRLLNYGIEGTHYKVSGDGRYDPLFESYKYPIYNNKTWCVSDQYRLNYQFRDKNILSFQEIKQQKEISMAASSMKIKGLDRISLQKTKQSYLYPLSLGSYDNWQEIKEEYMDMMDQAGFNLYYKNVEKSIQDK